MERLTRKLEKRKATLADLCQLYRASSKLPIIEQTLRNHSGAHAELLASKSVSPATRHDPAQIACTRRILMRELLENRVE